MKKKLNKLIKIYYESGMFSCITLVDEDVTDEGTLGEAILSGCSTDEYLINLPFFSLIY